MNIGNEMSGGVMWLEKMSNFPIHPPISSRHIEQLLTRSAPVKWLFAGDSVTAGALTFGGRDYTEHFSHRIRYELMRLRDVIIKTGVGGRTASGMLDDFEWSIGQFKPDVVFVMLGTNDSSEGIEAASAFRANLERIVQRLQKLPDCFPILQTSMTILDCYDPKRAPALPVFMDIVREVATAHDVPLIDHTAQWQAYIQEEPCCQFAWLSDAIHPNHWGHLALAESVFQALNIHDSTSVSGRLFKP